MTLEESIHETEESLIYLCDRQNDLATKGRHDMSYLSIVTLRKQAMSQLIYLRRKSYGI